MKRTKKLAFILSVVLILNMFVAALSVSAATYTRTELETEENDGMNILGTYKYTGGLTLDRLLTAARTQEQGKPNKSYVWLPYGSATIGDPSWFESISDPDFTIPLTGDNLPPEIINITHDEWEEDTSETSWSSTISIPLTIYTKGMFNGTNRLTISGVKYVLTAGIALDDAAIAKLTEIAAKSEAVFKVEAGVVTELSGGGAELTEQQKVSIAYDAVRKGNYKDLPVTAETQDLKTAAVQKQVNTLITEAFKVKARTVSDVVATVTVDGTTYKVEIKCGETKDNFDIKDATFKVVAEVPTETPTFTTDLNTDEVTYDIKETPTVTPLTVLATVTDGGTISYQWYKNGAAIAGATDTSYTPSIETLGTATYHVVATNTKDGETATATSKTATIKTINSNLPDAEKPVITTNLSTTDTVYTVGDSAILTVVANSPDGGALSYQWYKDNNIITNANSSTYTVDTTSTSEATYYVQITNTKTQTNPSYVESNKLKVTVKEKEAEKLTVTFNSNDTTKGTVEAHVYESGKDKVVVTTSPTQVASGSKVVFLAKPTTDNVLEKWNNASEEITYTIEKLTANVSATATFIAKDKTPLEQAISGANVYATQISDGTILVTADDITADKVENGKKFVTEIEKDALITGLGLAEKLYNEVPPVVIETKKQITDATADLNKITDAFKKLIKTGTGTQKPIETVEINFGANNSSMGDVEAYVYENASSTVHTKVYNGTDSPINVASGSKVVFLAKPNSDYELENWNGTETGNTYTISNVTSDATVTANFKAKVTTNVPVESVTVNPATVSIVSGATTTLTATVTPDNATNKEVTWSSSNESVATVSGGVVTALSAGTATITATTVDGNKTATSEVTVEDKDTSVKIEFKPNNSSKGTVEAYVYGNKNSNVHTDVYQNSPRNIASGLKVVFLAKPNSSYVLKNWSNNGEVESNATAISYEVVSVISNTSVTANFIEKDTKPLNDAIVTATVYEKDLESGKIITVSSGVVTANAAVKAEVDAEVSPEYYVEEIIRNSFITELKLARKLYNEEDSVKIETENQITEATKALSDATVVFKGNLIKKENDILNATVVNTVYNNNSVEKAVYNSVSDTVYLKLNDSDSLNISFNVKDMENDDYTINNVKVEGISNTVSGEATAISGTALKLSDKWSVTVPVSTNDFVNQEKYLVLSFTIKESTKSEDSDKVKVYIKITSSSN